MIPEVADKLPESVRPLGKRYDDVDKHAACVHPLVLNLHHGGERPEEHQLGEVPRAVAFKRQLVNSSSVLLRTSHPCRDRLTRMSTCLRFTAVKRSYCSEVTLGLMAHKQK